MRLINFLLATSLSLSLLTSCSSFLVKSDTTVINKNNRSAASVDTGAMAELAASLRPRLNNLFQEFAGCDVPTWNNGNFIDYIIKEGLRDGIKELEQDLSVVSGGNILVYGTNENDALERLKQVIPQVNSRNLNDCNSKVKVFKNCIVSPQQTPEIQEAFVQYVAADSQSTKLGAKVTKAFRESPKYKSLKKIEAKKAALLTAFANECREKARTAAITNVIDKCKATFLNGLSPRSADEQCIFKGDKSQLTIYPEPMVDGFFNDEIKCGTVGYADTRKEVLKISRITTAEIARPSAFTKVALVKQTVANQVSYQQLEQNSNTVLNGLNSNNISSKFSISTYMINLPQDQPRNCSELTQKRFYEYSRVSSQLLLFKDLAIKIPVDLNLTKISASSEQDAKLQSLTKMQQILQLAVNDCNRSATLVRNCRPNIKSLYDVVSPILTHEDITCSRDSGTTTNTFSCSAGKVLVTNQIR